MCPPPAPAPHASVYTVPPSPIVWALGVQRGLSGPSAQGVQRLALCVRSGRGVLSAWLRKNNAQGQATVWKEDGQKLSPRLDAPV